jgi:dihydroorotate dehydrogenase
MSGLYRRLIRPLLFAQEAELVHERTMGVLGWISRHDLACDAVESFFGALPLTIEAFGLKFPNPIGLAAGMDKFASAVPAWESLGFGFSELGGVTFHPQPGNPAPRLFRAVQEEAIVNRMGFNNPGAEIFAQTLAQWRQSGRWPRHPVGINLGKSKITPLELAAEDYARSFRILRPYADFFVVNVSSPNTPGLRQLQDKAALSEILAAIEGEQRVECRVSGGRSVEGRLSSGKNSLAATSVIDQLSSHSTPDTRYSTLSHLPILVKVSPDLSYEALDEILELVEPRRISGIVATNTTLARPECSDSEVRRIYAEQGGLSGKPLRKRSTEIIRYLYRQTHGRLPIIGVGGVFDVEDAWEKITSGASLIQVYTGLVYHGPGIASSIVYGLAGKMETMGWTSINQAIGAFNNS